MAVIRQQNVDHHASYAGALILRRNILRHQQNATYQNEIDKLTHGHQNGTMHLAAMERLVELENQVNSYKQCNSWKHATRTTPP